MQLEGRFQSYEVSDKKRSIADELFTVKTGKYRTDVEKKIEHPPDTVYDTFAAFVDDLL